MQGQRCNAAVIGAGPNGRLAARGLVRARPGAVVFAVWAARLQARA